MTGHLRFILKKAGVCLNGAFGQFGKVSERDQLLCRLVEADMTVAPDTKHLDVNAAQCVDGVFIRPAGTFHVLCSAVRHHGGVLADVHTVKQLFVHEIAIALVIVRGDRIIFIKVDRADTGKVQFSLPILLGKAIVHSDRGVSGRKSQHAVGLVRNDLGKILCRTGRHLLIILYHNNFHIRFLLYM